MERLRVCCGRAMISGLWRCVRKNFRVDHYINLGKRKSTEEMELPKQTCATDSDFRRFRACQQQAIRTLG